MSAGSPSSPEHRVAPAGPWLRHAFWSHVIALGYTAGGWIGLVAFQRLSRAGLGTSDESALVTVGLLFACFAAIGIATVAIVWLLREQRTSRNELARSEEHYRILIEDNPALILRFDSLGRVTFANDTSCRFNRLTWTELLGKSIYELTRGPNAETLRAELKRILSGPGPYGFLGPFEDGGGDERWIEWKARRLEGDEFHAVGIDVTGRHLAEQESRRMEQRVFQTQKQESLGLIAGGLAHDFNNLLTGILGHADLALAAVPAESAARPHLDRIIESAHRIADSNRQLLAFAGKGKLLDERFDLNVTIRRVAGELRGRLPTNCHVELVLDEALPAILGDENQMAQAIRNVLLNAVESQGGRPNPVAVQAEIYDFDAGEFVDCVSGKPGPTGYAIRLTVTDSGSGIDDATLPRIFDPFFTTKTLGRGLGLSAVHAIVAAHGGAIRIESEVDCGTTVRIAIPPAPETTPGFEISKLPRSRLTEERRSVLIVDDEDSVRMILAEMVMKLGWEVLSAESGRKGIEGFRGNADRIAFVVLDLMMPDMDGRSVQAAIREIRPGTPILFCTGYSAEPISTSHGDGPSGLLLKPFLFADLEAAIAALLAQPLDAAR